MGQGAKLPCRPSSVKTIVHQEFRHFFLSNFPSIVVTIWYGQSELIGKPA